MQEVGTRQQAAQMLAGAGIGGSVEAWSKLIQAVELSNGHTGIDGETVLNNAAACVARLGSGNSLAGFDEECQLAVRELHHRIKNELQVIVSQMRRQSRAAETQNDRFAWSTCISQIVSLASLHDLLIPGGSAGEVDLAALLGTVCEGFSSGFGMDIDIATDLDRIYVSTAIAEPLALLLNEALTNAIKYGSSGRGDAPIRVRLKTSEGEQAATLSVANEGSAGPMRPDGFGSRLIDLLASKLGGEASRTVSHDSYLVQCTFPLDSTRGKIKSKPPRDELSTPTAAAAS